MTFKLLCTKCQQKFNDENKGKWKQSDYSPLIFLWYCTKCFNLEHKELVKRHKPRIEFLKARASKEGLTVNEYYYKHKKELRKK